MAGSGDVQRGGGCPAGGCRLVVGGFRVWFSRRHRVLVVVVPLSAVAMRPASEAKLRPICLTLVKASWTFLQHHARVFVIASILQGNARMDRNPSSHSRFNSSWSTLAIRQHDQ